MKDDRLRTPVDEPYLVSLGRAAFCFASMEWNAACCCSRMQQDYLNTVALKTAGNIADDFVRLAGRLQDPALRRECVTAATEFKHLVKLRNGIVHAYPATAPGGAQRLFRQGKPWTAEEIDDAADAYTACSLSLNALLYGGLADA